MMTVGGTNGAFRYIVQTDNDVSNTTSVNNKVNTLSADVWYNFNLQKMEPIRTIISMVNSLVKRQIA